MSGRLEIGATPISGLHRVRRLPIGDERGYLERLFCDGELAAAGLAKPIRQINRTMTAEQGAVRGLHFQKPPHTETKMVSCLRGTVFDVAVDLRRGSKTFLRWHGEVLSDDNDMGLLIPEGFAHGFQTMSEMCELLYFHTASFEPAAEDGLNALDPRLAIAWPQTITLRSPRDIALPVIDDGFTGFEP